jgi:hypothetical protein
MTVKGALLVVAAGAIMLAGGAARLLAQGSTPIDFQDQFQRVGGEIGLTSVWQSGQYGARCGLFEKGAKINPMIAAAYDYPLSGALRFEGLLGYQGASISGSYNSRELVVLQASENRAVRVPIDFENVGEAHFSYIFLQPSLKLFVVKGIFIGAGLNAGLLTGASTQYTKNILTKSVEIPDLGLSEVYYPESESSDPYSKTFDEEDRTDAAGFAVSAVAYAGVEVNLSPKLTLAPRITYGIPFTPVFTDPDLKLNALQLSLGVRYELR